MIQLVFVLLQIKVHINIKRDRCPWRAKQKPGLEQTKKKEAKTKGKNGCKKRVYCSEYGIIKSCTLFNINKKTKKNKKAIVK